MIALFKHYASIEGRCNREEYIRFFAVMMVSFALTYFIAKTLSDWSGGGVKGMFYFLVLNSLVGLTFLIPGIATGIRRLHDLNLSGKYLWALIAVNLLISLTQAAGVLTEADMLMATRIFNFAAAVFLMTVRGTDGANAYGPGELKTVGA